MNEFTKGEWLFLSHGPVTKEEYMQDCEMKWDGTVKHGDVGLDFIEIAAKDEKESDITTIALCGNGPNAKTNGHLIKAAPAMYEALKDIADLHANYVENNCETNLRLRKEMAARANKALAKAKGE